MNPAPRTTEEEWEEWPQEWIVRADLARELETELTEMQARAERAEAELATATEECKNVRLKWHAVMGTCAAKEDAIMEVDEELARLEAELEKVYALVTPVGFDLPGGIFETAQAVTELRAERDQLRADRTYNHECINRLASATGTLGENSEGVVDVVLSTIDQLRSEVNEAHAATHHWCNRAERAEDNLAALEQSFDDNCRGVVKIDAELAKERARLDSGQIMLIVAGERVWHSGVDLRAAIDAGMREGAK